MICRRSLFFRSVSPRSLSSIGNQVSLKIPSRPYLELFSAATSSTSSRSSLDARRKVKPSRSRSFGKISILFIFPCLRPFPITITLQTWVPSVLSFQYPVDTQPEILWHWSPPTLLSCSGAFPSLVSRATAPPILSTPIVASDSSVPCHRYIW